MNKIGALLFSILLLCGALLWGLAPESYNQYLKQELINTSSKVLGKRVNVESISFNAEQGFSEINQLTVVDEAGNTLINADKVVVAFNSESLKSQAVVINQIDIEKLTLNFQTKTELEALINNLSSKLSGELNAQSGNEKSIDVNNSIGFIVKRMVIKHAVIDIANEPRNEKNNLVIENFHQEREQGPGFSKDTLIQHIYQEVLTAL